MNQIKAILFDFGGTLDHDGLDWYVRLYDLIHAHINGIQLSEMEEYARFAFDRICTMEGTTDLLLDGTIQRIAEVLYKKMKEDHPAISWNSEEVANGFASSAGNYINTNRPVLEKLRQNYRLGCISNNWGNTAGWCRHYNLDDLFETMTDSTRVGCMKPDPRIFQAALDEMGLPAGQCVYVGDRFDCDVLGSREVGMTPVWIRHERASRYKTIENPDEHEFKPITVSSVRDLAELPL